MHTVAVTINRTMFFLPLNYDKDKRLHYVRVTARMYNTRTPLKNLSTDVNWPRSMYSINGGEKRSLMGDVVVVPDGIEAEWKKGVFFVGDYSLYFVFDDEPPKFDLSKIVTGLTRRKMQECLRSALM